MPTLGRSILTVVSLFTSIAPYLADWNETHIHNPHWPPHARYHNGQTMTTGLLLGLCSLYHLHFAPKTSQNLNLVLLFQILYYVPSLSGIWYPGAGWTDPEFGEGRPQLFGFPVILGVAGAGWWIERGRLGFGKRA